MNVDINKLWNDMDYSDKLRNHCYAVNKKALELADSLIADGIKVNRDIVDAGSLLHDFGRAKKHELNHGVLGYEKLVELGVDEEIARIARNHVGAGIRKEEAEKLSLPDEDFMPTTIEQKIVSYADNLIDNNKLVGYEKELVGWKKRWGNNAVQVQRFRMQHEELENYIDSAGMIALEESAGIPKKDLMEKAGKGVAEFVKTFDLENKKVLVFCGSGNNGGDGFVTARYLKEAGISVEMAVFDEQKTKLSKENFKKAEELGIPFHTILAPESVGGYGADIVVDAICGTGLRGEAREPLASVIDWINRKEVITISVDIPSGLNPDNGEANGISVNADYTICVHKVKKGLVGNENAGEMRIVKIF
ncbi:MAG: NAD(P)H-hydrate epimerase [Candidatus Undinarchaeales archaeon]|jgi:uncharacterized protein (TIGR00295 family)|nr:NAD(P)H-hydrate epimerase [Candidatus Undinarchaeales archaeon]